MTTPSNATNTGIVRDYRRAFSRLSSRSGQMPIRVARRSRW